MAASLRTMKHYCFCGPLINAGVPFLGGFSVIINDFSESPSLPLEAPVYLKSTISIHCIGCSVSFLFLKCPQGTECPFHPSHLLQIKSAGSFQSKPSNQRAQLTTEILNILNPPFSCNFKGYMQCNSVLVPHSLSLFLLLESSHHCGHIQEHSLCVLCSLSF